MRKPARRVGQNVELFSRFLGSELAATAAYRAALEKVNESSTLFAPLERALKSHQDRVDALNEKLERLSASQAVTLTPWKKMTASVVKMAASIHPFAAVELLAQGELNGLAAYEAMISELPPRARLLMQRVLLPAQRLTSEAMGSAARSFALPTAAAAA